MDFTARLEANLAKAEADYARIEESVMARREAGVDTSAIVAPSAQSSDMTLAKAAARVSHAAKALADYRAGVRAPVTPTRRIVPRRG